VCKGVMFQSRGKAMPIVPYYLGRPARIWTALVPRRRRLVQR
jgi:hypothetical protein